MARLPLTFACDDYVHMRAIRDERVRPEGIDLTFLRTFPAETFQRMVQNREFHLSEMGLKFYVSTLALEDPPFIAIPVFPSRAFRHSAIYVNAGAGIADPADLIGKKVGEPFAYGHDAAIWARGILSDEYGVPVTSPTYYVGAFDMSRKRDFAPFLPHSGVRVVPLPADQTLTAMLEAGELDALYSAIVPPAVLRGDPRVVRLFADYEVTERAYYAQTRIFPIMHTVVIRRDVYREHPWVARSLYAAFAEAKRQALEFYRAQDPAMHRLMMLPWLSAHTAENRLLLGDDFWPYGLEPNRAVLETFLRYHREQGLSTGRLQPEDLFARETLTEYGTF